MKIFEARGNDTSQQNNPSNSTRKLTFAIASCGGFEGLDEDRNTLCKCPSLCL